MLSPAHPVSEYREKSAKDVKEEVMQARIEDGAGRI
jgi:hypothetical protein